ncbi:MAG: cytoplasmic glycerophosphodiester phosphodiesterase [Methanosaeta sp. PtaU1.Bin060]|nr:MAG: cytoplasmic glycerophosphodiester phosphodiesterase [Methanosaeta sp. PtaU1.Bin060]
MPLVIGHRGARSLAPENTLEGIRVAAHCRADWVEVDIRLSLDGALVLMHDETVDRTTGGSGRVEDLDLAGLKALDLNGQRIPTLQEAVATARELGICLVVEMKEEGLEELVAEALKGSQALVTSFYHSSLREIKELSSLKTGVIIASLPVKPIELALWAGADAIFPKRVNPRLFKEAHQHGLKVFPWTINEKDEASWLLRLGADGLVTDDPCLIRAAADQPIKGTGKGNCEYYPCHHFEGQDCTHCFCPLYPCKDYDLGRFVRTKRGKRVWTCIDCKLVHEPIIAKYLTEHPQATTAELKALEKSGGSGSEENRIGANQK